MSVTSPDSGVVADPVTGDRWIKVTHFHLYHDWPSKAGLRWIIFRSRELGFEKVIRRVGRRLLIDEQAFFSWLKDKSQ